MADSARIVSSHPSASEVVRVYLRGDAGLVVTEETGGIDSASGIASW
jgi:hypothetical protein